MKLKVVSLKAFVSQTANGQCSFEVTLEPIDSYLGSARLSVSRETYEDLHLEDVIELDIKTPKRMLKEEWQRLMAGHA